MSTYRSGMNTHFFWIIAALLAAAMLSPASAQVYTWEDKNGGGKRSKLEVVVENFQFVGGREGAGGGGGGGGSRGASSGGYAGEEAAAGGADFDGIPF